MSTRKRFCRRGGRRTGPAAVLVLVLVLAATAAPAAGRAPIGSDLPDPGSTTDRPAGPSATTASSSSSTVTSEPTYQVEGELVPVAAEEQSPGGSVIGGQSTTYSEHPYAAQVANCSASVIDREWLLTAAHCVDDGNATPSVFVLGSVDGTSLGTVVHPLWNGDTTDGHDLALVRVPAATTAGAEIVQAGEPFRSGAYAAERFAEFVGMGTTDPDVAGGSLNEVTMRIRSDGDMNSIYDPWWNPWLDRFHGDLMIGAGSRTKTVCFGDSGGPLTTFLGGERIQIGANSFGSEDCNRPAVYGELDGANLAWLATEVPSIIDRWATCTAGGRVGTPVVHYRRGSAGPKRDGAYSWGIRCVVSDPPPPSPPPEEPPICLLQPQKCDHLGGR